MSVHVDRIFGPGKSNVNVHQITVCTVRDCRDGQFPSVNLTAETESEEVTLFCEPNVARQLHHRLSAIFDNQQGESFKTVFGLPLTRDSILALGEVVESAGTVMDVEAHGDVVATTEKGRIAVAKLFDALAAIQDEKISRPKPALAHSDEEV